MSFSTRNPRAYLAALVLGGSAIHCSDSKCEETETCSGPYGASSVSRANASPDASRDATAESSVEGGPDVTDAAGTDADADADVRSQADADGETGSACSDSQGCGCADLQTDARHCGACWHECPSGTCSEGVCTPLVVASGAFVPRYVTVDSTYIYWVNKGTSASGDTLVRIRKSGTLEVSDAGLTDAGRTPDGASAESSAAEPPRPQPTALAAGLGTVLDVGVVGDYLYWIQLAAQGGATIWRADRGGAGRMQFAAPFGMCSTLLLEERAYCAGADGIFVWLPDMLDGGTKIEAVSRDRVTPTGLAVGPSGIYWARYGSDEDGALIQMAERAGGQARPIAQYAGCAATTLALSSESVYWGCQRDDATGYVLQAPLAGLDGGAGTIVAETGSPWGMTVDGSNVYWCDARSGEIVWTPLNATAEARKRHVIGRYEDKESCQDGFAIDATDIYWTNARTGTVMRTAKP